MKFQTGEKLDNFMFDTPFEPGLELKETAERVSGRTALLFLRYYGCTLCQLDIHRLAAGYGRSGMREARYWWSSSPGPRPSPDR